MPGVLKAVISVNCHGAAGRAPDNQRFYRNFHANCHEAEGHAFDNERLSREFR